MGGLRVEGRFLHAILYTIFRLPGIARSHRRFASNGPDFWPCLLAVIFGRVIPALLIYSATDSSADCTKATFVPLVRLTQDGQYSGTSA